MKKILPVLFLFFSLFFSSCETTQNVVDTTPVSYTMNAVTEEYGDYAIVCENFLDSKILLKASFYDESGKFLTSCDVATLEPNKTSVFHYDSSVIESSFANKKRPYIAYSAYKDDEKVQLDSRFSSPSTWLSDLKNNYTKVSLTLHQSIISHEILQNMETQKSTSVVYDETNTYIEFKLFDDLSWLKGKWVMTEGYGYDAIVFNDVTPFSAIENYNNGVYSNSQLVLEMFSLNNFSDRFYVNKQKNQIKIVHPYALDPNILIISIYEKAE